MLFWERLYLEKQLDCQWLLAYLKVRNKHKVRIAAMALATITSKGQVTIPKAVRDSLKLYAGDKIEFVITEEGQALLRPVTKKVDDVFGRLYKPGRKPISIDKMNAVVRQKMKANFR